MAVTRASFYSRFPEWDLTDTTVTPAVPDAFQDARVDAVLAAAEARTDRTLFPTTILADECVQYCAAYLLARNPMAMNMRLQKSRGDNSLVTGEDVYYEEYRRVSMIATVGNRVP